MSEELYRVHLATPSTAPTSLPHPSTRSFTDHKFFECGCPRCVDPSEGGRGLVCERWEALQQKADAAGEITPTENGAEWPLRLREVVTQPALLIIHTFRSLVNQFFY